MSYSILTRDQHFQSPGPKRILALDGGGLRGIITLGYLKQVETLLRVRHGDDPSFRLGHYFDLIAGTSTGAIIAAGLAIGLSVEELITHYLQLGRKVFKGSFWRQGMLRDRYDEAALIEELRQVFGDRQLGDPTICTGLLVVTKRMDTGSPWPLGNNPKGRYFSAKQGSSTIPNAEYPLWQVVRASTAAPTFFGPERLTIARESGKNTVRGEFVDGGVSPHNNPALQALMYATLDGYRVRWPTGANQILLVSIGTGRADPSRKPSNVAAVAGINALSSLMDDCATLVETLMQWLSSSASSSVINRELDDLGKDLLAGKSSVSYCRYQLDLTREGIDALKPDVDDKTLASLREMDRPANLNLLKELGELAAKRSVRKTHFPSVFDLPGAAGDGVGLRTYRRRDQATVSAIPLDLAANPEAEVGSALFTYYKWGARQTCKRGDWLVYNGEDVHTVDRDTFASTYTEVRPGQYSKTTPVWAERAECRGEIVTKEGSTRYKAGDYLVYNKPDRKDGYAVTAKKFAQLYEVDS